MNGTKTTKTMKGLKIMQRMTALLVAAAMLFSLFTVVTFAAGVKVSDFSDVTFAGTGSNNSVGDYTFTFNNAKYQMLDAYDNNGNMTFYVLKNANSGYVFYASSNDGYFDPEREDNIGYWLNKYVLTGTADDDNNRKKYQKRVGTSTTANTDCEIPLLLNSGAAKNLDTTITGAIDKTHVWTTEAATADGVDYTFTAGIGLLSATEVRQYADRLPSFWQNSLLRTVCTEDVNGERKYTHILRIDNSAGNNNHVIKHTTKVAESIIYPTFYLNDDFFITNKDAVKTAGGGVKELIASNIPIAAMRNAGWTDDELLKLGYETDPNEPAVAGEITISADENLPGYKVTITGIDNANNTVRWYTSATENGTYTYLTGTKNETWAITNACANKYIKAKVKDKWSNAIEVGAALGAKKLADFSNVTLTASEDHVFTFDGKKYYLLDSYNDKLGNKSFYTYLLNYGNYNQFWSKLAMTRTGKFDPNTNDNIGYWLNNFVLKGAADVDGNFDTYKNSGTIKLFDNAETAAEAKLNETIRQNIDPNHIWLTESPTAVGNDYTFKAGIGLLSATEMVKYKDKLPACGSTAIYSRTVDTTDSQKMITMINTNLSSTWKDGNIFVRPTFYLNDDFFINNRVDPSTMGEEAKKMIRENISLDTMREGNKYSLGDLGLIGYDISEYAPVITAEIPVTGTEPNVEGKTYPGYKVSVKVNGENPSGEITWYKGGEAGTGTQIAGATGNNWAITNACANSYIWAVVSGVESNRIPVGAALGAKKVGDFSGVTFAGTGSNNSVGDYTFIFNNANYQMLDTYDNDGNMTFYVLKNANSGYVFYASSNDGYFDPEREDNIGYWLNKYVLTGTANDDNNRKKYQKRVGSSTDANADCEIPLLLNSSAAKNLDTTITGAIDSTHVWVNESPTAEGNDYTFTAGIGLLSATEVSKYADRLPSFWQNSLLRTVCTEDVNGEGKYTHILRIDNSAGNNNHTIKHMTKIGESIIYPTFYLNDDFFVKNYVNPDNMGAKVKEMIRQNISGAELMSKGTYDEEDLEKIGYGPVAHNVVIAGIPAVGQKLAARYQFDDRGHGEEDPGATYQWQYAESENGEYTDITDATGSTYIVGEAYQAKYIKVVVTPNGENAESGEFVVGPIAEKLSLTVVCTSTEIDTTAADTNTAKAEYTVEGTGPVTVIIAVYDETTGVLEAVQTNVLTEDTEDKSISVTVDSLTGKVVKTMAWNGLGTMVPLTIDERF